jgi:hypothetical protein
MLFQDTLLPPAIYGFGTTRKLPKKIPGIDVSHFDF